MSDKIIEATELWIDNVIADGGSYTHGPERNGSSWEVEDSLGAECNAFDPFNVEETNHAAIYLSMVPLGRIMKSPKKPANFHSRSTPRPPTNHEKTFGTDHYRVVSANEATSLAAYIEPVSFTKGHNYHAYDKYVLVDDASITPSNFDAMVPKGGVRLSDGLVGIAIHSSCYTVKDLNQYWPAEFDSRGMIRAQRMPLGEPFTIQTRIGSQYVSYYGWVGGIHLLCGQEGLDAGLYQVRPSFEEFAYQGIGVKKGYEVLP